MGQLKLLFGSPAFIDRLLCWWNNICYIHKIPKRTMGYNDWSYCEECYKAQVDAMKAEKWVKSE